MEFEVTYNSSTFTGNGATYILTEKCNSIFFQNLGTAKVYINNNIVIDAGGVFSLENFPNEYINQNFNLVFETSATKTKKLIVIRKFTNKVYKYV